MNSYSILVNLYLYQYKRGNHYYYYM